MSETTYRPRVTTIPATLNRFTAAPLKTEKKRRVAAYARVSTDEEEQKTSYGNQVSNYTDYIRNHDGWAFVKVYTDEGITGTSTRHREGFNSMIADARAGKIDLIITKSISRFARNTVDTLIHVRELKDIGVEIFFEKENIWTLDSKGELLITIMSSLAQEESRSISENVTWGIRKSFRDGKVHLPYAHFLGYRKGTDDLPEIVPEEAEIVRSIYRMCMEGKAPSLIARELMEAGIPSPAGKAKWRPQTIRSILTNEKYKGDALLQKRFCTNFLTKKTKVNEGEVPQYYVDNSHPAIIDPELWEAVQNELKKRTNPGKRNTTPHCFSGRVFCEECGGLMESNTCRNQIVWQCTARHRKQTDCTTPAVRDRALREAFVSAINKTLDRKDEIIAICEQVMEERCDVSGINAELITLQTEQTIVQEALQRHIMMNARIAMDQETYHAQEQELENRDAEIQVRMDALNTERTGRIAKLNAIRQYIALLREESRICGFDEQLFRNTVEAVRVMKDGTLRFEFKSGLTIDI